MCGLGKRSARCRDLSPRADNQKLISSPCFVEPGGPGSYNGGQKLSGWGSDYLFNVLFSITPFGLPVYQTSPTLVGVSDTSSESSISQPLSVSADTMNAYLNFTLPNEMSESELLACIFFAGVLIVLLMWHYENFCAWIDNKWQHQSLAWRRWRNHKRHPSTLEIKETFSISAQADQPSDQDGLRARNNNWFLPPRDDLPGSAENQWFLTHQSPQPERSKAWFFDLPQESSASETQTETVFVSDAENVAWRSKWETLSAESSQAIEEARLVNQTLNDRLESESEAHERVKMDLVMVQQNMDVLQARLDCQRDAFEVARSEQDQNKADHDAAMESLKLLHRETLEEKKSEFEVLSSSLMSQAEELQKSLDLAHSEATQLRSGAAEAQGIIETLKAAQESSQGLLQKSDLELAESIAAFEKEEALRLQLEGTVNRLNQGLSSQTEISAGLEADLLASKESLESRLEEEQQQRLELQGKVDDLGNDLNDRSGALAKLSSELQASEKALAAARAEKDDREMELLADAERLEQDLSDRSSALTKLESEFQASEKALAAARADQRNREAGVLADRNRLREELDKRTAALSKLQSDLFKSEEALVVARADEGKRESELRASVVRLEQELSGQTSTSAQLAADLSKAEQSFSNQIAIEQRHQKDLQARVADLEQDLDSRVVAFAQLEADLSKAQQDLIATQADRGQQAEELQSDLNRADQEIAQLRSQLTAEQANVARTVEEFSAHESLIQGLKEELSIANVNRANYTKLAKKAVRYKTLTREKDAQLEHLTGQNTRMSDLATEYFESLKELRNELGSQTQLVADLKQQLQETERNKVNEAKANADRAKNGNGASNGPSEREIEQRIQQRAREHVLKLKSDFEVRIKRKNQIIRKLRKDQVLQSDGHSDGHSDGNGFVEPHEQPESNGVERLKVNLPR